MKNFFLRFLCSIMLCGTALTLNGAENDAEWTNKIAVWKPTAQDGDRFRAKMFCYLPTHASSRTDNGYTRWWALTNRELIAHKMNSEKFNVLTDEEIGLFYNDIVTLPKKRAMQRKEIDNLTQKVLWLENEGIKKRQDFSAFSQSVRYDLLSLLPNSSAAARKRAAIKQKALSVSELQSQIDQEKNKSELVKAEYNLDDLKFMVLEIEKETIKMQKELANERVNVPGNICAARIEKYKKMSNDLASAQKREHRARMILQRIMPSQSAF